MITLFFELIKIIITTLLLTRYVDLILKQIEYINGINENELLRLRNRKIFMKQHNFSKIALRHRKVIISFLSISKYHLLP